jgi:C1A family cysteine protease
MPTPIDNVQELGPFQVQLRALGYRTVEQVLGAARSAPRPMARYLGLDDQKLTALQATLSQKVPAVAMPFGAAAQPVARRLGVRLDFIPRRPNVAMAFSASVAAALPPSISLIDKMRPVRNQANRGTCVAHAALAAVEHYWGAQGKVADLSRQFAYWDCKQHDGHPDEEGTWIGVAMPLLQSDGCPTEDVWPYVPNDIPGNEGQGPAPAGAMEAAAQSRIPGFRQLAPNSVRDIKAELADGRPVAFSIPVFDSWYLNNPEVEHSGDITNPIPGELADGGHAMCLVGYEDRSDDPAIGGGRFLLRNSWGTTWASGSTTGTPGYGTIPYSYIAAYAMEAFSVR